MDTSVIERLVHSFAGRRALEMPARPPAAAYELDAFELGLDVPDSNSSPRGDSAMDMQRKTFSKTFATAPNVALTVVNRAGAVRVRGVDSEEVRIDAEAGIYADSAESADAEIARIERGIERREERVEINTPELLRPAFSLGEGLFGRGPHVDYDITVPRSAVVSIDAHNGRVEVRRVEGPVAVDSHNGAVEVVDCRQMVSIDSHNGKVDVRQFAAIVKVTSHNGRIVIEDVAGDVDVEGHNGPQSLVNLQAGLRARTDNGAIEYEGRVAADIALDATNGSLRLRLPRDSRFEIDAESVRGAMHSDFDVRSEPGEGAGPRPRITLRTVHGGIRLEST